MLRWCIGLDLHEHLFLPVDQPAFTVELLFVSGVIRLLLPLVEHSEDEVLLAEACLTLRGEADEVIRNQNPE